MINWQLLFLPLFTVQQYLFCANSIVCYSFKTHPNKYNYEIGEIIMSHQHYEPEFKKKLVRLHLDEERTLQSLSA